MGQMVSPADVDYDPESEEYPDPLKEGDAVVQQYLQNYNSIKRNENGLFDENHQQWADFLHSAFKDFFTTCSDPELGEDDLPGTGLVLSIIKAEEGNNGISTTAGITDIPGAFGDLAGGLADIGGGIKDTYMTASDWVDEHPLEAGAIAVGAGLTGGLALGALPAAGATTSALMAGQGLAAGEAGAAGAAGSGLAAGETAASGGFLGKALSGIKGGVKKGLKTVGQAALLGGLSGLGGGGGSGGSGGIPTTNTEIGAAPLIATSNNRYEMPISHIEDNLYFDKSSARPPKRDEDIETLRQQVVAALAQWSKSGEVENRAEWWVYYSYAHEAETIAELQTILTAIPAVYHDSVLTAPTELGGEVTPGDTGLPEPASTESISSPTNTNMSPIPIDGVGTPPKMPANQQLIPGAMASHDQLKVRPIYAPIDEKVFVDYVEEDRQVLARVASFIQQGVHEEDIVETLHPSYGVEYTIWAIEEVKKVAAPLDEIGEDDSQISDSDLKEIGEWLTEQWPDKVLQIKGMGFEIDPMSLGEYYLKEEGEWEVKELLHSIKDAVQSDAAHFPLKGEHQGVNEDTKINQQADSNLTTPANERVAEYTSLTPDPMVTPMATGNQPVGLPPSVGLPPAPETVPLVQQQQMQQQQKSLQDQQLQQTYPGVHPDVARQYVTPNLSGQTPNQNAQVPVPQVPAGNPAAHVDGSPAGETAGQPMRTSSWKDIDGNLLQPNQMYKMTSSSYGVPDHVRVISNGSKLELHITEGNIEIVLDEKEVKRSKYQFEPVDERTSSFLSESGLSTFEQRALIDESGIARNLDRLNLDGTHYIFTTSSKDDTIDVANSFDTFEDFFIEDLDLFI
jgi:hypothetical protein